MSFTCVKIVFNVERLVKRQRNTEYDQTEKFYVDIAFYDIHKTFG